MKLTSWNARQHKTARYELQSDICQTAPKDKQPPAYFDSIPLVASLLSTSYSSLVQTCMKKDQSESLSSWKITRYVFRIGSKVDADTQQNGEKTAQYTKARSKRGGMNAVTAAAISAISITYSTPLMSSLHRPPTTQQK